MGKKVLVSLVVLSLVIGGVTVLQSMGGELTKGKSEISKKPKIKFAEVDVKDLKVAKVERLTDDAYKTEYKSYMYPKWSPDGKMIAFTSAPGFEGAEMWKIKFKSLWVMNADGSNKRKLTDEEGIGYNFEWTPDSKSIVYKPGNIVKEIEIETKKTYPIVSAKKSISPMIKQPSGEIITVVDNEVTCISKAKDTKALKACPIKKSKPQEERIVYSLNSQIWSANSEGENKVLLSEGDKWSKNCKAILSPTGKKVCCIPYNDTRVGFVINIDGKNKTGVGAFPYTPSWSPDGSKILYAEVRIEEETVIYPVSHCIKSIGGYTMWADIYVEDLETESLKNLTDTKNEGEISPDWSPDGSKIVYISGKNGDIYLITLGVE